MGSYEWDVDDVLETEGDDDDDVLADAAEMAEEDPDYEYDPEGFDLDEDEAGQDEYGEQEHFEVLDDRDGE